MRKRRNMAIIVGVFTLFLEHDNDHPCKKAVVIY